MPPNALSDTPRARAGLLALCLGAAVVLFGAACASLGGPEPVPAAPAEASSSFEEARAWARRSDPLARERARDALKRALAADPEWVAPRRMLDLLDTEDLLGLDALAAHRAELAERPDDGALLYLAGRLEGERGIARFERAARVAPGLAWAHHGLGWAAAARRQWALALRHSQRALELARDPWERTYFTSALARYHFLSDQPRKAIELLEARLAEEGLAPVDFVELSVQTATIELSLYFQPEYQRGWERALRLLRECDLTDGEVEDLVRRMRVFRTSESASLELQLALASRPGAARDRWRAEILIDQRPSALALGLLRRAGAGESAGAGPLMRAARFAAGQFRLGTEEWLGDLPHKVLDEQGLPLDSNLRRVALAARALSSAPEAGELAEFGDALLDAGWFREARAVAATLAVEDLDRALALEDEAAAGQQLLADVQRLFDATTARGARSRGAERDPQAPPPLENLDSLLAAIAPAVARAHAVSGGETDAERLREWLRASPRLDYGGLASVVHPGPWFSRADERNGLGTAGEPVGGLAELLGGLGRFGLFGQLAGDEPDGTILSRVLVEPRSGEHLGVPWSGTVAWCEGADLKSRAGRLGAEISGAALHEGYWVDLDSLRRERAPWVDFEQRFFGDPSSERIQRALATRGLALASAPRNSDARRRERREISTLLGESERLRLAVIADRRAAGNARPGLALDELLEATAVHEEGHLCDRTRFLPISKHLWRAAALFAKSGFSPSGVARRLEYRAQLVALCGVSDPRVPLVSVLRSAEGGGSEVTAHADAYRELLVDLLETLDRELERDPQAWPELDPDHVLAHQLHLLPPEAVRRLARTLAEAEGLFER